MAPDSNGTKFLINIIVDLVMFICFWQIFTAGAWIGIAYNVLLFVFWLQGLAGMMMYAVNPDEIQEEDYVNAMIASNEHLIYQRVTSAIETILLVALGHWFLGLVYLFGTSRIIALKRKVSKRELDKKASS